MAQLDKTFPTQDCSLCILSPKLVEVSRSPNVSILTRASLEGSRARPASSTCTVRQRPRYIDTEKCTGCGSALLPPTLIPDVYNERLCDTKALHLDYPQAVPAVFSIDENSLFLQRREWSCASPPARRGDRLSQSAARHRGRGGHPRPRLRPHRPAGIGALGLRALRGRGHQRRVRAHPLLLRPLPGHVSARTAAIPPHRLPAVRRLPRCAANPFCSSVCCMYAVKEAGRQGDLRPRPDHLRHGPARPGQGLDATRLRSAREYRAYKVPARLGREGRRGPAAS